MARDDSNRGEKPEEKPEMASKEAPPRVKATRKKQSQDEREFRSSGRELRRSQLRYPGRQTVKNSRNSRCNLEPCWNDARRKKRHDCIAIYRDYAVHRSKMRRTILESFPLGNKLAFSLAIRPIGKSSRKLAEADSMRTSCA